MSRAFLLTLCVLWLAGSIAGVVIAQDKNIPWTLAAGALPAFLVELSFFISMAFERERAWWTPRRLVVLSVLPYLLASLAAGSFSLISLLTIPAAVAVVCLWPGLFGASFLARILFLAIAALPRLFKVTEILYGTPHEDLPLGFLGQLLWIRAGILTALAAGYAPKVDFGFLPGRRDFKIGAAGFLVGFFPLALVATGSGFVEFTGPRAAPLRLLLTAVGNLLGIYLVVALSEEMFFRAMLQQWLPRFRIAITSVLFGAVHLGYREFPNYPFAITAAVTGVLYGLVYEKAGLRAAMVCHALTVTCWRAFFR